MEDIQGGLLGDLAVPGRIIDVLKERNYTTVLIFIALSGLITLRIGQNQRNNKLKYKRLLYLGYTNQQIFLELKHEIFTLFFILLTIGMILSVIYTLFSVRQIDGVLLVIIGGIIVIFSCIEYIFYKSAVKKAGKNIFTILEQTVKFNEPVNISTKDGNAVVISEEEYRGLVQKNPYQTLPSYEKLQGDLQEVYSRRINVRHRLVYEVLEEEQIIKIISLWTHYEF